MRRKVICIGSIALFLTVIAMGIYFLSKREPRPMANAAEAYLKAVEQIPEDEAIQLHITIDTQIDTADIQLHESSDQILTLYYEGGSPVQVHARETLRFGTQTVELTEVFRGGTIYLDLNGSKFSGSSSLESFLSNRAPAVMLHAENYDKVEGQTGKAGSILTFSGASTPESWALPADAAFLTAEGSAQLTSDGRLTESSYRISYAITGQTVTKSYTVTPYPSLTEPPVTVLDSESYRKISDTALLKDLERACGYLLQIPNISSMYSESIFCQAFGDTRTRTIRLDLASKETFAATMASDVSLINSSRGEDVTTLSQLEQMKDGAYSLTVNGQASQAPAIGEETFRSYCRDLLVGTVILPEHIADARLRVEGDVCYLEFDATEALADSICADACNSLYQDPDVLDEMATHRQTNALRAWFSYSKTDLLPISSGILFDGTYTINDLPYQMEFNAEQTYSVTQ